MQALRVLDMRDTEAVNRRSHALLAEERMDYRYAARRRRIMSMSFFLVNPKNKRYPATTMALILTAAKSLGAQGCQARSSACAGAHSSESAQSMAEMPGERIT